MTEFVKTFGVKVDNISYENMLERIATSIRTGKKISIGYAGFHSLNRAYSDPNFRNSLASCSIIHHDGFAVYFLVNKLLRKSLFQSKLTGSEFYERLIVIANINNWKISFFGDTDETLSKIKLLNKVRNLGSLNSGYNFNSEDVILNINRASADILLVGLGVPLQENWVNKFRNSVNTPVVIIVGEGIKIFSGTKRRGPKLLQKFHLEWSVRLFFSPLRLWRRYLIGFPIFIFRIIVLKFKNRIDILN